MLDVIRADYVRTAKAKGLRELTTVVRHAAKNAVIPVVTIAGVYLAFVVTGSFYVESVTGVPGLGRYLVLSISARDYPRHHGHHVALGHHRHGGEPHRGPQL